MVASNNTLLPKTKLSSCSGIPGDQITSMTCSLRSALVRPAFYITNLNANVILVLYNSSINKVNISKFVALFKHIFKDEN